MEEQKILCKRWKSKLDTYRAQFREEHNLSVRIGGGTQKGKSCTKSRWFLLQKMSSLSIKIEDNCK